MATIKKTTTKKVAKKTTKKKTTAKKTAAKAPAKKRPAAKKPAKKAAPARMVVSLEQRFLMIQEAAYLLAAKNGFEGDMVSYWLEGEKEIGAQLG